MTKSSSPSIKKELAALPVVRIDTMDQSYVLILREYLFTNGCQVFVNSGPTDNVTYYFVVGDSNFVKKTLAFRHDLGKKQIVICWDPEDHESIGQFLGRNSKIVYIDPTPLTKDVLSDILTFLFTAKGKELDMQTQIPKRVRMNVQDENLQETEIFEPPQSLSSQEFVEVQKLQIAKTITDLFGQKHKKGASLSTPDHQRNHGSQGGKTSVRFSRTGMVILFAIVLGIAPFILYLASFFFRGGSLLQGATNLKEGNGGGAAAQVGKERFWEKYSHLTIPVVHGILRFPLGEKAVQSFERMDVLFDRVADVESELLTINSAVLTLGSTLLPEHKEKQTVSPIVAVDTIRKSMPSIRNNLDLSLTYVQSFEKEKSFPFSFPFIRTAVAKATSQIDTLRQIAEVGERISQLYPFVGGFRDKHHMLIMLQNSSELRPTGGFIGSLAHLTVSEGSLEEMRIEDVYTLDGQLKGHVDPPPPVKELLGQEHWYLRDSNWNPDFSKTAQTVQFFYEKETGERVESVVGITSSFIVRILRAVGPVDIPLYNDRITADNFYLKSFYYTQVNFFPGSSQKKDFLGTLMEALFTKLQKNPQSGIAIVEIVYESLMSHDIQWYMTNPEGQEMIELFGWGGKMPSGSTCLAFENAPLCLFSYIHINEANLSVNKVNAFVDRSQMRSVQISDDGKVTETVTRKLQNLSQGELGTGVYTAYLRIFFPSTSTLTGITLDGKTIPMKDTKAKRMDLPYGELDTSIPNLTGIGVAFEVSPGRERVVSITMTHKDLMLAQNKEAILTLFEQKQAGVDQVPSTTTIVYPPTWNAIPFPSTPVRGVVAKPGYLEYNTVLSEDCEFSVRFVR